VTAAFDGPHCVREGADGDAARKKVEAYVVLFNILPRGISSEHSQKQDNALSVYPIALAG